MFIILGHTPKDYLTMFHVSVVFIVSRNAESFFLRSLKIREKLVGSHHFEAAQSYHNLASLYNQKKNYVQAVEYMNKALKIR